MFKITAITASLLALTACDEPYDPASPKHELTETVIDGEVCQLDQSGQVVGDCIPIEQYDCSIDPYRGREPSAIRGDIAPLEKC